MVALAAPLRVGSALKMQLAELVRLQARDVQHLEAGLEVVLAAQPGEVGGDVPVRVLARARALHAELVRREVPGRRAEAVDDVALKLVERRAAPCPAAARARPGARSGASSVGCVATPPRTSRIMLGENEWNQPPPKLRLIDSGVLKPTSPLRQVAVDAPLGPAEEDVVLGREVVVDPHLERVRVVRLLAEVDEVEVVDDLRSGEVRPQHVGAQQLLHRGRDQVRGDLVARERVADDHAVHDARAVGVEERRGSP